MAYRILLIEDDTSICEVISDYFNSMSGGSMELVISNDGSDGLEKINNDKYDLILLDVMLPGIDGFSVCRELRRKNNTPLIFITARTREEDILYGYELGCDDYITKPFRLSEFYAKVNAMLRRTTGTDTVSRLICGKISLDPHALTVFSDKTEVELPPKEFALLRYLLENKNRVVDRDTLLNKIWGYDYFGNDRVVDNHIKKLRKALGECGRQIKTVIKRGYKLTE